jgi:hypothetical protein
VQNQQFNIVSKATGISILSICRFYFINYQGGLLNENEPEGNENPVYLWLSEP